MGSHAGFNSTSHWFQILMIERLIFFFKFTVGSKVLLNDWMKDFCQFLVTESKNIFIYDLSCFDRSISVDSYIYTLKLGVPQQVRLHPYAVYRLGHKLTSEPDNFVKNYNLKFDHG